MALKSSAGRSSSHQCGSAFRDDVMNLTSSCEAQSSSMKGMYRLDQAGKMQKGGRRGAVGFSRLHQQGLFTPFCFKQFPTRYRVRINQSINQSMKGKSNS